jgi:GT2 family glycosyltransferase
MDHDDEITPDALLRVVEAINAQPDAGFIYSDECKIDDTPARRLFHFALKPDWSPEIMFNCMLTGHLSVYRKSIVDTVGGFRGKYDFSQDYDLALRVAEVAKRIVHIERILYLWRAIPGSHASGAKNFARETNVAALADSLKRRGIPGTALALSDCNYVHIAVPPENAKVSVVIPSDSIQNLRLALDAVRQETAYPNYEVVVVCNGPLAERLSEQYCDWPALHFVRYNKKYNFSDKCNEGARTASGDIIVFYNDDVFPLQADWIQQLIEYLWVPGVGGVSPKLLYPDDTIQYAGMISGTPGLCGTAYHRVARDGGDAFLPMHKLVRNVSILSGACCALRKDVFWAVGGFDAVNTPDGHSDLDLSYKLREAGYRNVYTPHAVLRHVGNHSWGAKQDKYKADIFCLKRWGRQVSTDPYFTESMKHVFYGDFRFEYRIHAEHIDPHIQYSGRDVLFVSHELTLSGAPRMLFYAAQTVKKNGGFPVVVAPEDGPLREEMERAGLVVIIDESIRYNHFLFERFARNFDLAIVNTIVMFGVVKQLSAIPILRTVWWLHEGQMLSDYLEKLEAIEWERVRLLCVSAYAKAFLPPRIEAEVLHNGVPDEAAGVERRPSGVAMTFLVAGTIEPRKGQDLFIDAIAALPPEIRKQCRFLMNGKLWEVHQSFWKDILARVTNLPEVTYLGALGHVEQLRAMADSDVLVCCSRDEPFSLVAMEAATLSKPTILSDHVGAGEVLGEGSSLKFPSGDVMALSKQLRYAFEHRQELKQMGVAAREKFEEELSIDAFERRFTKLLH